MPIEIYIYYRAQPGHSETIRQMVERMQVPLAREYGLTAALKRKQPAPGAASTAAADTWMEVYLNVNSQDFEHALTQAVAQNGLMDLIDGERHTEYFLPVSACA